MMNILAYADGDRDLIAIADEIGVSAETCLPIVQTLLREGLLKKVD